MHSPKRYTEGRSVTKQDLSKIGVRLGLSVVRALLRLKGFFGAAFRVLGVVSRPLTRFFFVSILVPVYHLFYTAKRRFGHWYRPAKNRLMFLLTNRYALHATIVVIAAVTGIVNIQMSSVRAETIDAFNQSLLYSIITQEDSPIIEVFADTSASPTSSYLETSGLAASTTSTSELVLGSSSFAGGGSISVPLMTSSAASVAPRESVETYIVDSGDTLSTIAARFGISMNTLLWANNLSVRSTLKLGMELTILPVSGVLHTVKSGDTLSKIASTYGVTQSEIIAYNNLASGEALAIGEKLLVPGGEIQAPEPTRRSSVSVKNIFVTPPSTSAPSTSSTGARMLWPTDGHYIVRGLSWYHTGVDVDCDGRANGTSTNDNYAAADGVVQFSGWKGGYGNAVEINHGNGLVTRYGHFYQLYVTAGQTITAGTPLGRCGSTGNSTGTHLHFEVIGNGKFKNPLEYIR